MQNPGGGHRIQICFGVKMNKESHFLRSGNCNNKKKKNALRLDTIESSQSVETPAKREMYF